MVQFRLIHIHVNHIRNIDLLNLLKTDVFQLLHGQNPVYVSR